MRNVLQEPRDHFRKNMPPHAGPNQQAPYPTPFNDPRVITRSRRHARRSVIFTPTIQVHRYPPAVWGDDEEVNDDDEWDVGSYRNEDLSLAEEAALAEREPRGGGDSDGWMSWEEALPDPSRARGPAEEQRRQQEPRAQQLQQQLQPQQEAGQQAVQQRLHQQRQQIEEQRGQQQIMAHTKAGQTAATSTQGPGELFIRHQGAREQLVLLQDFSSSVSPSSSSTSARAVDPIDASETKMGTISLPVQRSNLGSRASPRSTGPMLPREVMQQQEEERKQTREDIGAIEEAARNKAKQPSSGRPQRGEKLRKEPQSDDDDISRGKDKKGKSGGLFGRLLDRRKHANKEKGTNDSIDISWPIKARSSEESGRSSSHTDNSGGPQTPSRRGLALTNTSPPVSQHTLRQRDGEQQVLYQQQYLTLSPASLSEAQPLLQTLSPTSDDRRPRPGSPLILGNINGDVPDEIAWKLLSESTPSSSGASGTNIPPHEASFALHGNSTAAQLELTMQLLSEFLPPSITVIRTVELNGALKESLRRAQGMLDEYLHMVKKRDDWWRARLVQEQRRREVLEQSLQSVEEEGEMAERRLSRYLGRHTSIDSDISDWEGLATIQTRPPTLPLEEPRLGLQEHIQDTTVQTLSTSQRPFVADSTVASGSLDATLTASSFTTHSVVSSTSISFMDTGPVNRDDARLLQTMSTSFTETAMQVR